MFLITPNGAERNRRTYLVSMDGFVTRPKLNDRVFIVALSQLKIFVGRGAETQPRLIAPYQPQKDDDSFIAPAEGSQLKEGVIQWPEVINQRCCAEPLRGVKRSRFVNAARSPAAL